MTPPNDHDAERSVIGALLMQPAETEAAEVYSMLSGESFYRHDLGAAFDACRALYVDGKEIDEITVGDQLQRMGRMADVGGIGRLAELTGAIPTTANVVHYARIVRERWLRRQLIAVAAAAHKAALELETPITETLDRIGATVSQIATAESRAEIHTMRELVRAEYKQLQVKALQPDEDTATRTGFYDLDKLLNLQPGHLLVLAGRPGMGKTAMATAIAENVAIRSEEPVLVISLEMPREELVQRALSSHARVDGQLLRRPSQLEAPHWSRIADAAAKLDTPLLHIVDTPALNVLEIRALARLVKARLGRLGLVVVDYVGLVKPVTSYPYSREREVAEISAGLKNMAKELGVPVMALAQLNRALESRADKRPGLSDLRDSGSLEQDADAVIFVYRDGYYDREIDDVDGELIIGKQRSGPIGVVSVGWDGKCAKYFNLQRGLAT